MPREQHNITRDDLLPLEDYGRDRKRHRAEVNAAKRDRRVDVGPHASFYFESYATMWFQIHEMLWVEKGGEAQIEDELRAYNPLIPNGHELTATLMFEIDNRATRERVLAGLGGVEDTAFLRFAGHEVTASPETDMERSTPGGRASSVQFLHFAFTDEQIAAFCQPDTAVTLGLAHADYPHSTQLSEATRAALAADLEPA